MTEPCWGSVGMSTLPSSGKGTLLYDRTESILHYSVVALTIPRTRDITIEIIDSRLTVSYLKSAVNQVVRMRAAMVVYRSTHYLPSSWHETLYQHHHA